MLGSLLPSPLVMYEYAICPPFASLNMSDSTLSTAPLKLGAWNQTIPTKLRYVTRGNAQCFPSVKWKIYSAAQTQPVIEVLAEEEREMWQACRDILTPLNLSVEEVDVILSKAFGWTHSPYWGEEKTKTVPKSDSVNEMVDYLKSLGISDDDLYKLLKKFPEVLGCGLNEELKKNVGILERHWGIDGKTLRSVLLRNPKVLGYNVDCEGDCMAQCTRCWARF